MGSKEGEMPKEKFYDSATDDGRRLEVAWLKGEGDVTVGTLVRSHPEGEWEIVRVPLSADHLDDLIATLRRARRGAYGVEVQSGVVDYGDSTSVPAPHMCTKSCDALRPGDAADC